jgi:uncharacterized membrane protein YfcA
MNTLAGGGGLVIFPVLLAVVSPVCADATSGFALLPAYVTSTWKSRRELVPLRHRLWLPLGPILLGALLLGWSECRRRRTEHLDRWRRRRRWCRG